MVAFTGSRLTRSGFRYVPGVQEWTSHPLLGDVAVAVVLFVVVEVARRSVRTWRYPLWRLFSVVLFAALSCGCFWMASVNDITVAIIPGVLSVGLGVGLLTNHIIAASVGIAVLALASNCTRYNWDGAWPAGEIRLRVCDPSGSPIAGVQLEVCDGKTHQTVHRCNPVWECGTLSLLTDANGSVMCHSPGWRFSGGGWYLFWCVPIGWHSPEYECRVSHKDYHSVSVPFLALLNPSHKRSSNATIVLGGEPMEMAVYTSTVTMPRK